MLQRKLFLTLVLALLAMSVRAEIYQWRDAQGRIHFGDKPAPHQKAEPVDLEPLNTMTPVAVPKDLFTPKQPQRDASGTSALPYVKRGSVVMFTTPTCVYCGQAKDYMKRKGIPYQERDITASKAAREEFVAYGGHGVPLMLIGTARGTRRMSGFSEERFASVYGAR